MKKILIILFSSLIGILSSPNILAAADDVDLTDLNKDNMVETVAIAENTEAKAATKISSVAKAPAAGVATPVVAQTKNYTVNVFSGSIVMDCGNSICKTGKLLYAHNTANLLGNLSGIANGEIFTITENGVVTSYRVAEKVVYEKTADGYLNGNPYLMGNIVNSAMGHSVALMTCTGTAYGNGDASHRLVVYADAI